jgi:hypothetical protein
MEKLTQDKFLYRRQFVSGPELNLFPTWPRLVLPDGNTLAAHPDLTMTSFTGKHFQMVLLGYLLDPYHPERDNEQVLADLDEKAGDFDALCDQLYNKSGHYILFAYRGVQGIVLNDAAGLRPVYYHQDAAGKTWFTSHAPILANLLHLPISEGANHFMQSAKYKAKVESWFPADTSPYEGLTRIIPNHYLDLSTLKQVRFWPLKKLKRYSLKQGAQLVGDLIKGTCEAGFNRFPAAVALTAGFDSRVVLAGCRSFVDQAEAFTMIYRRLTEESEDLVISRQVSQALKFNYRSFTCDQEIPADFVDLFQRSTEGYKTDWINLVYGRYVNLPPDKVVFKGTITEPIRCGYWPDGIYPVEVTVYTLADVTVLGHDPFVIDAMDRWMQEAKPGEKFGFKLLDLFAWEVGGGSWQAMSHSIFGFTHEEFSPFGNRKLLEIALGVNKRHRSWPNMQMEQEVVRYLWPELAEFPYYSSWNLHGYKKKFYDGDLLNFFRKVRHRIKR